MNTQTIEAVGGLRANLAPDAFARWARHYHACMIGFASPDPFSPVPYFLLCRSLELSLKARHLRTKTQEEVRKRFGHELGKSYAALPPTEQILSPDELALLESAGTIYADKKTAGFEYFNPEDALTGFKRYPDLAALQSLAAKLLL